MLDPDDNFKCDFNFSDKYFNNDRPEYWERYTNPTSVVDNVYYKLNSKGYRCDEFNLESELPVVFMGCSHAFGLGLPLEDTWAYRTITNIRNKTNKNIPYWNLARNGSSIDLQFWNLHQHIAQIKPKFIFFLIPTIYRRFVMFNNHFHKYQVNNDRIDDLITPLQVQNAEGLFVDEYFAVNEAHKYFMLINGLCERYNTKMFFQYTDIYEGEMKYTFFRDCGSYPQLNKLNTLWVETRVDYARDRMHYGPKTNENFANNLWQEIKQYF